MIHNKIVLMKQLKNIINKEKNFFIIYIKNILIKE